MNSSQPRWPALCLVTDTTLVPVDRLPGVVAEAVAAGVTMVQLREPRLPTRELLALAERLRAVLGAGTTFTINGRADIARAAQADGVHLPSHGLPPEAVRVVLGRGRLVGRSTHTAGEVEQAHAGGCDYVEFGTIFPSRSHPGGPTTGLDGLRAVGGGDLPVLAIGGITAETASRVAAAGANGIAVISAILGADDPGRATEELIVALRAGIQERDG